jgi:hypothetical protein
LILLASIVTKRHFRLGQGNKENSLVNLAILEVMILVAVGIGVSTLGVSKTTGTDGLSPSLGGNTTSTEPGNVFKSCSARGRISVKSGSILCPNDDSIDESMVKQS